MGIKQHNGNTKADRLAELKIRSPSIQLIKFGAIGLNAIIFSPLLIAADTGSQYGTNITINDGDRITGDTADPSGNLYGVMTPAGNTPGNINLGNDVTVNVNDASGYAKGIIIQGKNSSLTANRLTVDVVGQTSAIGINLIGDYTHADLGTGSTIKSNDDGIIIGHSSTLTATQFTIENSNGIGQPSMTMAPVSILEAEVKSRPMEVQVFISVVSTAITPMVLRVLRLQT